MELSLSLEGVKEAIKFFTKDLEPAIDAAVSEIAENVENTPLLNERVYQNNPPSPNYVRTGRLNGGRKTEKIGKHEVRVEFNPQIKGATENYGPMTNKNKLISKLNTLWFDDTLDIEIEKSDGILQKHVNKTWQ